MHRFVIQYGYGFAQFCVVLFLQRQKQNHKNVIKSIEMSKGFTQIQELHLIYKDRPIHGKEILVNIIAGCHQVNAERT